MATRKSAADALREEAEALGGAQRSTTSGLVRKGESSESSNRSDEDIENKDVPVEDPEEEELDKEAEEDEEHLEGDNAENTDEPETPIAEDSEVDEPEEEDAEGEDGESEGEQKPPKKSERRGNQDNAARRIQLKTQDKKQQEINELRAKVQQFEEAETVRAQEAIKGEIIALATELKSDPVGMEKVINLAVKIAEQRIGAKLPSKTVIDSITTRAQVSKFDTEFASAPVQDLIATNYPRATAKQIGDAKTLLKRLSKGSNYPLDYFLFKNKKDFDAILDVRRRRGLETARRHGTDTEVVERDTSTAKGIESLDEQYRNAGSGSGLRRERTSEKTF